MSVRTALSRAGVAVWGAAGISICVTPDTAPAWLRIGLAAVLASPLVVLLAVWPVLLVWSLTDGVASTQSVSGEGQETRIQVLDGGDAS